MWLNYFSTEFSFFGGKLLRHEFEYDEKISYHYFQVNMIGSVPECECGEEESSCVCGMVDRFHMQKQQQQQQQQQQKSEQRVFLMRCC